MELIVLCGRPSSVRHVVLRKSDADAGAHVLSSATRMRVNCQRQTSTPPAKVSEIRPDLKKSSQAGSICVHLWLLKFVCLNSCNSCLKTCTLHILPYSPHGSGWRGSQVVRQGSAKALCVGSIPTLASTTLFYSPKLALNWPVSPLKTLQIRPAWDAPSNSSELVADCPSSKRDLTEYGTSSAPLPTESCPLPLSKSPCHSALGFRISISPPLLMTRSR